MFGVDLGRIRALEPEHVAGDLDHRHVQTVADAEVGNPVLAGVARRRDLAFGAARAEAAGQRARPETLRSVRSISSGFTVSELTQTISSSTSCQSPA